MQNQPVNYIIPGETLSKVFSLLSERPYMEVAGLMTELQETVRVMEPVDAAAGEGEQDDAKHTANNPQ